MNSDDPETCTADIEQTWQLRLQHLMSFFVCFSHVGKLALNSHTSNQSLKIGKTAYIHIYTDNIHSYQLHTDM